MAFLSSRFIKAIKRYAIKIPLIPLFKIKNRKKKLIFFQFFYLKKKILVEDLSFEMRVLFTIIIFFS